VYHVLFSGAVEADSLFIALPNHALCYKAKQRVLSGRQPLHRECKASGLPSPKIRQPFRWRKQFPPDGPTLASRLLIAAKIVQMLWCVEQNRKSLAVACGNIGRLELSVHAVPIVSSSPHKGHCLGKQWTGLLSSAEEQAMQP
jgi:hypothetical protein